jgi:Rod binding domain-containing protein
MSGLPPIDQSLLPADVRKGTASDKKTYAAALGFERALLGELTKTMADTAKPDDGSGSDSADGSDTGSSQDSSTSMYMDMLPDQLANGLEQSGGLGLARTFYDSMKERGQ